jgi:hypothetical protein
MARTLTDERRQIVTTIRQFVEKEVKPVASALERDDRCPHELPSPSRWTGYRRSWRRSPACEDPNPTLDR